MAGQADHVHDIIPAQRCGDRTGHPYVAPDEWLVCVESPGHESTGIDHESPDGTRW